MREKNLSDKIRNRSKPKPMRQRRNLWRKYAHRVQVAVVDRPRSNSLIP